MPLLHPSATPGTGTPRRTPTALPILLALSFVAACGGDGGTEPEPPGALRVSILAVGLNPDPDGYDVEALLRTGTVTELDPDGPPARAGLREGMRVVDIDNAAPWIGRWDPDEPTVVVVETEEGERRYAFSARGGEKEIPAYVPGATLR